jgi:hypothetical protein
MATIHPTAHKMTNLHEDKENSGVEENLMITKRPSKEKHEWQDIQVIEE